MDAAQVLREARLAAGLSQAQLAERSGTSQATLCAYERGHKTPSSTTLDRILAASGRRLTTAAAARPVRTPGASALERAGRTLAEVVELAALLPARHSGRKLFPGLPRPPAAGGTAGAESPR